jgi:DNA-binding PadR family transcriptional regulator
MKQKREHMPVYHDPNWEDTVDRAKAKYFATEKGRKALKRARDKYYRTKIKPKNILISTCIEWLDQNPGKTVEDFLNERQD